MFGLCLTQPMSSSPKRVQNQVTATAIAEKMVEREVTSQVRNAERVAENAAAGVAKKGCLMIVKHGLDMVGLGFLVCCVDGVVEHSGEIARDVKRAEREMKRVERSVANEARAAETAARIAAAQADAARRMALMTEYQAALATGDTAKSQEILAQMNGTTVTATTSTTAPITTTTQPAPYPKPSQSGADNALNQSLLAESPHAA